MKAIYESISNILDSWQIAQGFDNEKILIFYGRKANLKLIHTAARPTVQEAYLEYKKWDGRS